MNHHHRHTSTIAAALRALADRLDAAPADVTPVALILGMQPIQQHPLAARRLAVDVLAAALGLPGPADSDRQYTTHGDDNVDGVAVSVYTAGHGDLDPADGQTCRHPSWCCTSTPPATIDAGSGTARI